MTGPTCTARARPVSLLLVWLTVGACSSGDAGRLMPVAGPGVRIVTDRVANDSARVEAGSLVTTISGAWANPGLQTLTMTVANDGARAVTIPASTFTLTHRGEGAVLNRITDVSGAPGTDPATRIRVLYTVDDPAAARAIAIPPRETRKLLVTFDNFLGGDRRPAPGCTMIANGPGSIPKVSVAFRCAD